MNGVPITNGYATESEKPESSTVHNAGSVADLHNALAELRQKEKLVTSQLDALISAQKDVQRDLGRLDLFRANLSTQSAKTRSISNGMLADAAATAQRISTSVKKLDLEQSRIKATLTVVEQVSELKACVLGVAGSMGAPQDWETAAGYLNRASKLPKSVVEGDFAVRVVPTAEVPDAPVVTLENASESLCGLFVREFDKAVKENDGTKITRFFKLFPLINRSEVGLDIYGRYVCQGVASRARGNLNAGTGATQSKDGMFYANALTKLFEHIAQIIDGHGGLVERHYGPGKMSRVIERLQVEADLQGGIIIDTWSDERRVERTLTDIKAYAYTFLVQSFHPAPRGLNGTPRSGSPAPAHMSEDEGVDMKQVDALLNEMTNMLGKWALYTRFVTDKSTAPDASTQPPIPAFLANSTLSKKVEDKLLSPFNNMTTFFFRRSVEKAFQMDEQPSDLTLNPHKPLHSSPPHISSAIEDIMYIINRIIQQILATSQRSVITSVVPTLSRILSSDFIGIQQRKMRDEAYPRPAIQGSLPPENLIISFIVLINNLDVAKQHIDQIVNRRIDSSAQPLDDLFPSPGDADLVGSSLKSFNTTFSEKTTELMSDGITVMFNNVMKPRLRPILLDAFRDTDYTVSQEELTEGAQSRGDDDVDAYSDAVRRQFQTGWDALTKPIARLMTQRTFDQLLTIVITYVSKLLEKRMWTYQGRVSQAGSARLEHDINSIIKVVVSGQKYTFRELFLRCSQICMILNMDEEEWEELQESGGEVADKLTPEERLRARAMLQG